MELLAGVVFAATVFASLVVTLGWLVVRERSDRSALAAWEDAARARGLHAAAARAASNVLRRFEGRHGGLAWTLEVARVDGGSRLVTVARARASAPVPAGLVVWARGGHVPPTAADGARLTSGDPAFDDAFEVRAAHDVTAGRRLLGATLRQAMQRFPTPLVGGGLALVYDRGDVALEWPGAEIAGTELDAALAVLTIVCPLSPDALRAMN